MSKTRKPFDYSFSNLRFWWYHICYGYRGCDPEKELNLDEAIIELINYKNIIPDFDDWYDTFCPKNKADENGILQSPNSIEVKLADTMRFAIDFHVGETTYYLNDIYIGNQGGHFEAWFLTWDELLTFERYREEYFLLLLTMTGITAVQRPQALERISQSLKQIPLFAEHADYIADCICNGLIIEGRFEEISGVGLTNIQGNSVRNVVKYPRYREDVVALNASLKEFCCTN